VGTVTTDRPTTHRPGGRWDHWPGQLSLHPDTRVLPDADPVDRLRAQRWALVPVTWRGMPWWYGWCPVVVRGQVETGWWCVPRDPVADPWPPDGTDLEGDRG
jgi:hypothetical protein